MNANDPAFPFMLPGPDYENGYSGFRTGMSIRGEIAKCAMAALIPLWAEGQEAHEEKIAADAVKIADALMAELNKPVEQAKEIIGADRQLESA